MEKEIIVEVNNVSKIYEGASNTCALDHATLCIKKGEFVGIVGDSGSGKTTLLNLIGGMDQVSDGTITVAGDVISDFDEKQRTLYRRNRVGFIFQDYNLISELTVYENIILPFQLKKMEVDEAHIDKYLNALKLGEKKTPFPCSSPEGNSSAQPF